MEERPCLRRTLISEVKKITVGKLKTNNFSWLSGNTFMMVIAFFRDCTYPISVIKLFCTTTSALTKTETIPSDSREIFVYFATHMIIEVPSSFSVPYLPQSWHMRLALFAFQYHWHPRPEELGYTLIYKAIFLHAEQFSPFQTLSISFAPSWSRAAVICAWGLATTSSMLMLKRVCTAETRA